MPNSFTTHFSSHRFSGGHNAAHDFTRTATNHMLLHGHRDSHSRRSGHGNDGSSWISPEARAAMEAFDKALGKLPDPSKDPLSLLSLTQKNFKKLDANKDGMIDYSEMASNISNDKTDLASRQAAAVLYRRSFGQRNVPIMDWRTYFTEEMLDKWHTSAILHNDSSARAWTTGKYIAIGAGLGAGAGLLSATMLAMVDTYFESKFKWIAPISCALAGAIGVWQGRAFGQDHLDHMERYYKSML